MRWITSPLLVTLLICVPLSAQAPEDAQETAAAPDYAAMDPAVLAIMASQLDQKIAQVQQKLTPLEIMHEPASAAKQPAESKPTTEAPEPPESSKSPEPPDHAAMDKAALVAACEAKQNQIKQMEARIETLRRAIAGEHGAEMASVDDDVVSVDEGTWRLMVTANDVPDRAQWEAELKQVNTAYAEEKVTLDRAVAEAKSKQDAAETEVEKATDHVDYMHEKRDVVTGDNVKKKGQQYIHSDTARRAADRRYKRAKKDLYAAKRAVLVAERKAHTRLRRHQVDVRRFEQRLREIDTYRELTAVDEDGREVTIIARGVYFDVGVALEVNAWYDVTGGGYFSEDSGRVTIKSAEPVDPPQVIEPSEQAATDPDAQSGSDP